MYIRKRSSPHIDVILFTPTRSTLITLQLALTDTHDIVRHYFPSKSIKTSPRFIYQHVLPRRLQLPPGACWLLLQLDSLLRHPPAPGHQVSPRHLIPAYNAGAGASHVASDESPERNDADPRHCRTYENTSFEKVDLIKYKPGALYQLTAISWFAEEDFLEVDIDPLWADIAFVTDSTPVVSPGELIDTLYPGDEDQDGDH